MCFCALWLALEKERSFEVLCIWSVNLFRFLQEVHTNCGKRRENDLLKFGYGITHRLHIVLHICYTKNWGKHEPNNCKFSSKKHFSIQFFFIIAGDMLLSCTMTSYKSFFAMDWLIQMIEWWGVRENWPALLFVESTLNVNIYDWASRAGYLIFTDNDAHGDADENIWKISFARTCHI